MPRLVSNENICNRQNELEILQYASYGCVDIPVRSSLDETDMWVTCKFSSHTSKSNHLYMGSNCGILGVFDINKTYKDFGMGGGGLLQDFPAHRGVIMDITSVPGKENEVVTVAGDSTIRLWDLNTINKYQRTTPNSYIFHGHTDTIRTVCFAPDSCNEFATGGRDGTIKLWDRRVAQHKERISGVSYFPVRNTIADAHLIREMPNLRSTAKAKKGQPSAAKVSVVSLLFLDDNCIVSAASNAASELRIWDVRKLPSSGTSNVVKTLAIPTTRKRNVGVTSLALNRFGSSLFASVTHNDIYEYAVNTSLTKPVRSLTGTHTTDFDIMMCTSPTSDYVLCGSSGNDALLWNSQDCLIPSTHTPKQVDYRLGGHNAAVLSTSWSCDGNYIATMDIEGRLRVWAPNLERDSNEELITKSDTWSHFKRIEKAPQDVQGTSFSRNRSPVKSVTFQTSPRCSPRKGRKRLHSTSSPTKRASCVSPMKTPTKSPRSKIMKLTSPVLPFGNKTNTVSPGSHRKTRRDTYGRRFNPFHAQYPTENLPNVVYERHIEALRPGTFSTPVNSPAVTRRLAMGEWLASGGASAERKSKHLGRALRNRLPSVSEFGESLCSNMVSVEERMLQTSPKKLVLKNTPVKPASITLTQVDENIGLGLVTPTKLRSSRKNLLDYFTRSNESNRHARRL